MREPFVRAGLFPARLHAVDRARAAAVEHECLDRHVRVQMVRAEEGDHRPAGEALDPLLQLLAHRLLELMAKALDDRAAAGRGERLLARCEALAKNDGDDVLVDDRARATWSPAGVTGEDRGD